MRHASAGALLGDTLASGEPAFSHVIRKPQSSPAAGSATLRCTPVPCTPGAPGAAPCQPEGALWGDPHASSMVQPWLAKCVSMSGTQDPVWVCLEDNGG